MERTFALICLLAVIITVSGEFSELSTVHSSEKINTKSIQNETTILYMVNNSHAIPGQNKLLEIDLQNKKYRVVTDKLQGVDDSVSGSALCGDNFFSVITNAPVSCKFKLLYLHINYYFHR